MFKIQKNKKEIKNSRKFRNYSNSPTQNRMAKKNQTI